MNNSRPTQGQLESGLRSYYASSGIEAVPGSLVDTVDRLPRQPEKLRGRAHFGGLAAYGVLGAAALLLVALVGLPFIVSHQGAGPGAQPSQSEMSSEAVVPSGAEVYKAWAELPLPECPDQPQDQVKMIVGIGATSETAACANAPTDQTAFGQEVQAYVTLLEGAGFNLVATTDDTIELSNGTIDVKVMVHPNANGEMEIDATR